MEKRFWTWVTIVSLGFIGWGSFAQAQPPEVVKSPKLALKNVPFDIVVRGTRPDRYCEIRFTEDHRVFLKKASWADTRGVCHFSDITVDRIGQVRYSVLTESDVLLRGSIRVIPGWFSLLPPLAAVTLAILFRQVVLALVTGVWLGALIVNAWDPFSAFLRTLDHYIVEAYADTDHVFIVCFSLLLGGMIGIISRSGGLQGLVDILRRLVRSDRSVQFSTWLMGVLIFFDDYANTLFVGTSMRPLADRFRISREKLSYLIDTTAAPMANIALISTWIGFEVSIIGDVFEQLAIRWDPYLTFLASIPYRFYPIMALILPLWLIALRKDFGSMYQAEVRARVTGRVLAEGAVPIVNYESSELMPVSGVRARWQVAVIPIGVAIATILAGLWWSGYVRVRATHSPLPEGWELLRAVLAEADSYRSLLWGSALGCGVAALISLSYRVLNLQKTFEAWLNGMRTMFLAVIILGLAWSIGAVCADVQTAQYLIHFLGPYISPYWIPALTTLVSAAISFAIGSSWATMSIVMPLVIPLAYTQAAELGSEAQSFFLVTTISSVLAGATFGDHCSPISDTTILSSIFSGADHIDHVRTQLPYALTVGAVAWTLGDVATAYGLPPWLAILLGAATLGLIVWQWGKPIERYNPDER